MKKTVLSIITLLTISAGVNAQNVNIPDANFKAYLVGNALINTNGDTEIQVNEATAFTGAIDCSNSSINDLTGIEAFTSLVGLYCHSNSLTALDVSSNTALEILECHYNQIAILNIGNNPNLTSLDCKGNELTVLDVSQCPGLSILDCSNNSDLALLDVTNNSALTELKCAYNYQMIDIDLSFNTQLEYLHCRNNSFTGLDLSDNLALTTLICNDQSFTTLDLSNNINLLELNTSETPLSSIDLSSNTALIKLNCSNNNLSALDLSANNALQHLNCQGNSLTALNVSNNSGIYTLFCSNNAITSLDVSALTVLSEMGCSFNLLTSLNLANSANINLYEVYATDNPSLACIQVDDPVAAAGYSDWYIDATASYSVNCGVAPCTVDIPDANFKAYLVGNAAINTNGNTEIECTEASAFTGSIDCSSSSISDLTGIEAFTALTSLNCFGNQLSSLDVTSNTALTYLSCSGNQLTSLNVSQNTLLETLGCGSNQLTSLDVSNNINLIGLHFYQNGIVSMDISNLGVLIELNGLDNALTSLNAANGNNTNFTQFNTETNPALTCIQVDDAAWSTTNWTNIDAASSFSEDCSGGLSLEENKATDFVEVYPNPTTGIVTFSSEKEISSIEVYSLTGQKVSVFNNTNTIDISSLPSGVYTARVIVGSSTPTIERLFKK